MYGKTFFTLRTTLVLHKPQKHFFSVAKAYNCMIFKKVLALGYGIHTKKAGTFCGENKDLFVKEGCSLPVVNLVFYKGKNLHFYVHSG